MSLLRTYDDWRAAGPHESMPTDDDRCEVCGEGLAVWRTDDADRVWLCEDCCRAYLRGVKEVS